MSDDRRLIFAIRSYRYLGEEMCRLGGCENGEIEIREFPDGERYQRIVTPVADREVALVGGTVSDSDTLELYDLACAVVKYGARTLTLVTPFYGYSTMERAVLPGEVVTAKTRARLFSAIPQASLGSRVILLDLHSEGIPHYFEGGIRPIHVYAKPLIEQVARRLSAGADFVLACTDSGRAKWVESLANGLKVPASFVFKRRLDASRTAVTAVSAQVKGRLVIIYDDMIRTGGSLLNAARAYHEAGATSIAAIATHGLFPGEALARLRDSGLLSCIVCTNSHPRALELRGEFLTVESVGDLLVNALQEA